MQLNEMWTKDGRALIKESPSLQLFPNLNKTNFEGRRKLYEMVREEVYNLRSLLYSKPPDYESLAAVSEMLKTEAEAAGKLASLVVARACQNGYHSSCTL